LFEGKKLKGKYNDGRYSNLVYDTNTATWKYLAPVPGGMLRRNHVMIYDEKEDKWGTIEKIRGKEHFHFFDLKKGEYVKIPVKKVESKNYYEVMNNEPGFPQRIAADRTRNTNLKRQGNGVAIATGKDGLIYWTGSQGYWQGNGEALVLTYDRVTDKWPEADIESIDNRPGIHRYVTVYKTDVPSMLERRIDHEVVTTSDGKIYAIGGWREKQRVGPDGLPHGTHTVEVSDTIECYDPQTNKWAYKKSLGKPRMLFAAVVGADDKIYVFGGTAEFILDSSTPVLDAVEVYDPITDTWISKAPMPAPRESHSAAAGADGKIYIMGGIGERRGPPLKEVLIYDPTNDTWEEGPDMRIPRADAAAVAAPDGKIYVIGGTDVGAYETSEEINFFLPKKSEFYTGKVQDTGKNKGDVGVKTT